jgi:hypothetical protein
MRIARQDGIALILAVLITFALSALTASLMLVSKTETWSGMNHRQLAQARYGAEAGLHQTANYLLNGYTPPGGANDPLANYDMTVSPVKYNGSAVVLSSLSAVASNYPVPSVVTAFQARTLGSLNVGNASVNYGSSAILVSMRQIVAYGSATPLTVQTWRISGAGSLPGSRGATEEVSAVLEQQITPTFTYAVFSVANGCSALSFSGGGQVDSFDSSNRQARADMAHHDNNDGDFHGGDEQDQHHGDGDNHDGAHHPGDGDDSHHGDEDGSHHHGDGDHHDGIHHEGDSDDDHGAGHTPGAAESVDGQVGVVTQSWGGNVGTNGNVGESHLATVKGTVSTPRSGVGDCTSTAVTALSSSGGATVNGGVVELPQAVAFQAPSPPSPQPPTGAVNISATCPANAGNGCSQVSGGLALTPGTYGDLNVQTGNALHVSAGVYNVNSLTVNGGGSLVVDSGPVVLSVAGQSNAVPVDFTGGVLVNTNQDPGLLQIQYSGNGQVNLAGGSRAAATIYAPNASVNFTNNLDFFGAVIANTFDDTNGALIHFDRHLVNSFFTVGGYMLHSFTWKKF